MSSFRYTTSYRHGYLDFQRYRGGGRRGLQLGGGGGGRGEKNRETVITSPSARVHGTRVPATQAFDWSLDNRCSFALTTGLV